MCVREIENERMREEERERESRKQIYNNLRVPGLVRSNICVLTLHETNAVEAKGRRLFEAKG